MLHWADPTTLDLLRGIAERGALAPLFVLITARPEFRPAWGMRSHHGTDFARAARPRSGAAHGRRACGPPRAAEGSGRGRDRAHRRRAAVRRGSDAAPIGARRAGRHPGDPADTAAIADGTARPARSSARGGADRRCDRTRLLLRAASRRGWDGGRSRCKRHWSGSPKPTSCWCRACRPNSDYRFKHALIQDAAYENLLKSRRQVLHRRVAETLRTIARWPQPSRNC